MSRDSVGESRHTFDTVTLTRDVFKSWWIALLVAAITAMVTYMAVTELYRPKYTATSTLVVAYTQSNGNVYSDLSAANTLADTFTQVLNSNVMREKVASSLGQKEFTGTVNATNVEETNLLVLTVTADTPQMAWQAAKTVLDYYPEITEPIMSNVSVSVLQDPAFPVKVSNPMKRTSKTVVAGVLGFLAVLFVAGVASYLRDTIKNETDFSRKVDGHLLTTVYTEKKYKTLPALIRHRKTSILISNPTTSFGFSETYKVLRTKVEYAMRRKNHKVLMVTSVIENEGKSTVSANLALALAQAGYRVILVDGDMRRPAVYKIFDLSVPNTNQLYALATGKLPFDKIKFNEAESGLRLLVSRRPCADSTNVINSDGMCRLLDYLREQADFVLLDMPPVSLIADAECMAPLADASLLVVRQNMAWAQDINDAMDALRDTKTDFLGCVFNNVHTGTVSAHISGNGGGYAYGYGYGYGPYGRYGQRGVYGRAEGADSAERANRENG